MGKMKLALILLICYIWFPAINEKTTPSVLNA
jgi:hypothetical protein